ncbi:MAG TPA: sigma-70 family RNA polymerase sigma factor [Candidatus Solibacter sp.]|nr:sigma-70 family RNA polymerase sigma factor [Candidatus Solibacter sp.]
MSGPGEVTALLSAWRGGDRDALERLIPIVYGDLRRIAARYMRSENEGHTLQATALVHEAYLRLTRDRDRTWENRAHFFGVAAQIMRNLLVDHARRAVRRKRGGGAVEIQLEAGSELVGVDSEDLLALDDALRRLAEVDPRASRIVELRYFVGLTNEEIAEVIKVSEKTVKRDWSTAKAWLRAELRSGKQDLQ